VIPGLIESHTHFVSLANRPGYHVAQLELATSIAEVQELLAARRARGDVPEGAFITAMGGWNPIQWAEQRLPTLAELDDAVPDRPVFLFQRFNGPSRVNSLGKQFFENVSSPLAGPVAVADDGTIAAGSPSTTALYHLRVRQTFEDKKRSSRDAMAFSAEVGVTALLDQTLVAIGFGPRDPQPNHFLANLDHFRMYDGWIDVHRDGDALVRLQMNFLHNQGHNPDLGDLENQLPELRERLKNQFPFFGDDMLRTGGIGEWAAPFALQASNPVGYAVWFEAQRLVAEAGWRNENSVQNLSALEQVVEAYERVNEEFPITGLRWMVHHVPEITEDLLDRLHAMECGVQLGAYRWVTSADPGAAVGPAFRTIYDHPIQTGIHGDGVHIAPLNPWLHIQYATTGMNSFGDRVNGDQVLTRDEALRLFTRENAWFLRMEDKIGSIEAGKLADLVVLDRDYFSVPDDQIRDVRSVFTVVDGRIVHDLGRL
jgi:hypothetical protein